MAFFINIKKIQPLNTQIKIFGIRHHGVGSALRLKSALKLFQPDIICVEMPFESGPSIKLLQTHKHSCPLAFLYYNSKNSEQTMYFPFSDFSPEYQAMLYASENNIPIYPIDLPAGTSIHATNFKKNIADNVNTTLQNLINDPLGYLAKKSGYTDTERWWDSYFESWTDTIELFDIIHHLMIELRKSSKGIDDTETLIREEFMRIQIAQFLKLNPSKLAIVCGAWHSPALVQEPTIPIYSVDLRELKTTTMNTGVIPWSYSRLALQKTYTAGIESPIWSECMLSNTKNAVSLWLSKAAKQLRKAGHTVSTAELIDCEKLSIELAMLREIPVPGIDELIDSCITVIGKGDADKIQIIQRQLVIGDRVGDIEIQAQNLSLILEFKAALKKLKLQKYWTDNSHNTLDLDLRKPNNLAISYLLHQSILLNLSWCVPENPTFNPLGNFHEMWSLRWSPEVEVNLINAAILSPTIESSIIVLLKKNLERETNLEILSNVLEHGIKSGLPNIWQSLIERIKLLSIKNNEVEALCSLIRPLIATIQYGNLHHVDIKQMNQILDLIVPKIILEFTTQCSFIKPDQAKRMIKCLNLLSNYFLHFRTSEYFELWVNEIISASTNESIHSLVRGRIWYIALEEKWCTPENFLTELEYQFLKLNEIKKTAFWIEGFMHQSTKFYLFQDEALQLMTTWINALDEEQFTNLLPILRRSFSELNSKERDRIFQKVKEKNSIHSQESQVSFHLHPQRENAILQLLKSLKIISTDQSES